MIGEETDPSIPGLRSRLYRAALCGSTLLMIGLSWPLWVDDSSFPQVSFFAGMPATSPGVSWVVFGGIVATIAAAAVARSWRRPLGLGLLLLAFAILEDQGRFQPWAYQFIAIGAAMVCMPDVRALRMARWYVVGLYAYSGLSKLDASFCSEMGPAFLSAALGPIGIEPARWPEWVRVLACLAMPAFEIAVALLLTTARTRRVGLAGAVAQHSALVLILGPWGLGHSPIVLVWNVALIVEDLILFGGPAIPTGPDLATWGGRLVGWIFKTVLILPAFERPGFCDAWPGHALYASHVERAQVFLHEDDLDRFPESIRRHVGPAGPDSWARLDLTAWSRAVRGTPMYPSGRSGNAVAEFLESRYGGFHPVRLVHWGRAPALGGARDRDESLGLRSIRRRGDRFRLNAHPR